MRGNDASGGGIKWLHELARHILSTLTAVIEYLTVLLECINGRAEQTCSLEMAVNKSIKVVQPPCVCVYSQLCLDTLPF